MEKKRGFGKKLGAFLDGKGFYIVLFLCAGVIGVSAWAILSDNGTDVDSAANPIMTMQPAAEIEPDGWEDAMLAEDGTEIAPPDVSETMTEPEPPVEVWADAEAGAQTDSAPVYVRPVPGEVEKPYSVSALIYDRTLADWRTHNGVDLAAELGDYVVAVSGGTVERVYSDDLYGTTVIIGHGGGLRSVYSNLAGTPTVSEGQSVMAGDVIGSVGETAICETGEVSHLHFAMTLDGASVDPSDYLP